MNLWRSLEGVVEVELTSAVLPEALSAINDRSLEIRSLQWQNDLTCRFLIRRSQMKKLAELAEKRGETLKVCSRRGLFWGMLAVIKRPVLTGGLLFFMLATYLLPQRILFVRVEGNSQVPGRLILEAAEEYGVAFGASRREIRSEKVKNGILSEIPQLQWVGVNTSGCVATVSVRERSSAEEKSETYTVSRIVAARDGYILSGTVSRGTGLFQPGQTVQTGQLLISGYTDGGFCIRAGRAEGEIMAQTNRDLMAVTPEKCLLRMEDTGVKRKISMLIGKKRINLWKDSGIFPVTCGRMYEEYYVTLPGSFRLPVALCVDTYTQWDVVPSALEQKQATRQLEEFAGRYLRRQMVAGTVTGKAEQITIHDGIFALHGHYICEEMIGREQPEQIGVTNGKNN